METADQAVFVLRDVPIVNRCRAVLMALFIFSVLVGGAWMAAFVAIALCQEIMLPMWVTSKLGDVLAGVDVSLSLLTVYIFVEVFRKQVQRLFWTYVLALCGKSLPAGDVEGGK